MEKIKTFLNDELVNVINSLGTSKLEADKLTALQAASNIITLLTQLEQLEQIQLNNMYTTKQLVEESTTEK